MNIFAFAPFWAVMAAINSAVVMTEDDFQSPDTLDSWVKFALGTGGPLAIGWFWYHRYNKTLHERSEFLNVEVEESRQEILELRKQRDSLVDETYKARIALEEAKLELVRANRISRMLESDVERLNRLIAGFDIPLSNAEKSETTHPQGKDPS